MTELLDDLSNDQVAWDGTFVGLSPSFVGNAPQAVLDAGEEAIPGLITALENEHSFVVAHVLLTQLSGVTYSSSPAWNGLTVDLGPDGAEVEPEQRHVLATRWQRWHGTSPKPDSLPEVEVP